MCSRCTQRDNEAVPAVHIRKSDSKKQAVARINLRRNNRTRGTKEAFKKKKTYDIINAGEQHRFSFGNGCIVAQCNFGFLYGMWWKNFIIYAKTQYGVDFSPKEARRIREGFFYQYNALPGWYDAIKEFAIEHGYVRSYDGRIRHLPMVYSQDEGVVAEALRQAINSPIQGFASDLGVMAISRVDQEVDEKYMAPVGFVHDAIYVLVKEKYVEWGAKTLKWYMESNPLKEWFDLDMSIPIIADVEFGWNAGETFEMEGLKLDKKYNFKKISKDDTGKRLFRLPKQKIPLNNGRLMQPEYLRVT